MLHEKGFTLIELVVTISIVVGLLGYGLVAIRDFNVQARLDNAVLSVVNFLEEARNFAQAPDIRKPLAADRYGIKFDPNQGLLELAYYTGGCNEQSRGEVIDTLNIIKPVRLVDTPNHVCFRIVPNNVVEVEPADKNRITVEESSLGDRKTITVNIITAQIFHD